MDPARWQRIEGLLQSALDLDPGARPAFLDGACGSDRELRRDVEVLLSRESEDSPLSRGPRFSLLRTSLEGRTISHYRIARRLGAGGMGEVYEAHDENLQRTVALKVLPEEFTDEPERVRRFEHEAFTASRLNHPNIITIHEIVHCDGARLIATELVEGATLRELLGDPRVGSARPLAIDRALDIAIQVATALRAAHTAWIIHRDIKPENIMVRSDGVVKVLDFGIAKLNGEAPDAPVANAERLPVRVTSTVTSPGAILGTARYMSPEQARGEPLDGRTDLFSLGVVLYEMLSGERFHGSALSELPAGRIERLPKEIQPVVRKLLRRNREERYASAGELLDDLHRLKRRMESRSARRMLRSSALAVAIAVAIAGLAAFLSIHETWDERVLRDGHTAAARQAVFSPDGRLLVSCSEDGQVIVWDFARREQRMRLDSGPAFKIAYSPDGRWLTTGGTDGSITVWDARRWARLHVLHGHRSEVTALTFSSDATRLASSSPDATVLWETAGWKRLDRREGGSVHGNFIFTADTRHLLSSVNLSVRDLTTGLRVSAPDGRSFNWLAFSPDATRVAGLDPHGEVFFYRFDPQRGEWPLELVARVPAHQDHGRAIAWSPDGRLLASAAEDILLWDAATQQKVARFEYPSIVWSVAFSPDGRWLLSTHGDGTVLIWDVAERRCVASLNEHRGSVRAVVVAPDGRRVASAGEDRTVTIWDLDRGRKEAVLLGHDTRVTSVAFSADGRQLASSDQSGAVVFWDLAMRRPRTVVKHPTGLPDYRIVFSPDGRFVATTTRILASDGRVIVDLSPRLPGQAYGADFSGDGQFLAVATTEGWVCILDGEDFTIRECVRVAGTQQISVSVSPDGKWLVTGEDQGAVRLWSTGPLRQAAVLGRHAARVKSVVFSPDGATVASAGDDKMIALWDVRRRELRSRIGTHASPVYSLAFSPDGRRLVSGEHDQTVRVYTRERSVWGLRLE